MALNLKQLLAKGPEIIKAETVFIREIPIEELGLTGLYILVAGAWCVFADDVFDWITDGRLDSPAVQALKGVDFVIASSLVLYLVLRRTMRSRRLAEEASRLNQERFESVALATTDAIWDLNLETKVVWWSNGVQKLFGYRAEDVSSRLEWWVERLHPDDRQRVVDALKAAADSRGRTWSGQYRFRRQDGSYAVVLDRGYFIQDAAGNPVRVVGGLTDISERRRAEEALEGSRRQLRALTAKVQTGREEERANVAREIHDELGQILTALKINLDWLEQKLEASSADKSLNPLLERVVETAEMTDSAIKTVQRIATDRRPADLDQLGLAEALREEAQRFEKRTGIPCDLQAPAERVNLARDGVTTIFRVFQEALTNVARHAQATRCRITLQATPEAVLLEVEDDGKGIATDVTGDGGSLGLLGMRERAAMLGGEVTIAPISPKGTRVTLRLPAVAGVKTGM